jgi:hypothetical protein
VNEPSNGGIQLLAFIEAFNAPLGAKSLLQVSHPSSTFTISPISQRRLVTEHQPITSNKERKMMSKSAVYSADGFGHQWKKVTLNVFDPLPPRSKEQ